ncbi:toprim domain-containing protein, partial [Pedobacter sp. L105]|uniref:toprim domain-containing protein n=1 Tax=Pedobacter sp. L105 TaxID=1641871 RepID=UPI00157678EE
DITGNYTVIAAYGTNGLNQEIVNAIKALPELEEIIFAFDNDPAGKAAQVKHSGEQHVLFPGLLLSALELPCKDVNETAQGHEDGIFVQLLEQRKDLFLSIENQPSVEKEKPAPQGKVQLRAAGDLNTDNPHKISYQTPLALYYIPGGI